MVQVVARSFKSRKARNYVLSEINITPFVDVMLVLLIVFMVTSPLMVAGINVDLPESSAAPVTSKDEPLSVTVSNDGSVYIQNTPIDINDLGAKLNAITKEKMDSRIFVRGDKKVDYGTVMNVVAIINEAGYEKVSLITEMVHLKKN